MTNEKKSNMSDEQKLYPQLIYRINSILSDIKSYYKGGELFIAPSVLDPYTRTFNWLMVNSGRWKFSDIKERTKVENHIQRNWEKFEKEFIDKIEIKTVSDAVNIVKNPTDVTVQTYHHALLSIYQFYPNNPRKYIDGIIYRNLMRRADEKKTASDSFKIDFATADLLIKVGTYKLYPWAKVNFYNNNKIDETKYSCQENNHPYYPEKPNKPDVAGSDQIKDVKNDSYYRDTYPETFKDRPTPATVRKEHFHKNYFVPYFVKDEGFNPEKFYELSPEYLSQRKYIYVKPLYDGLYGEYGNLCAVLQMPFKDEDERDQFSNPFQREGEKEEDFIKRSDVRNILINRLSYLVNEIKNAAFFEILKQPIEVDDLLEHFVKYLSMLQDWEFIRVFQIKNSEEVLLTYCYRRGEKGEEKGKWKRCERNYKECEEACSIKVNNDGILEDKELSKKLIEDKKKHIACDETTFGKGSMHKALLEDIFTERYIPELDEYDKSKCEKKIVIYEYPSYTIIPDDEPEEHKLGLFYERQQIDLLRQLAIKRKVILETIRHGTKAATNAIISRNFSHHIGSHVIPRATVEKIQEKVKAFHRSVTEEDLLKIINTLKTRLDIYNQKKSDFMAEIATEPLATTKSMYFYKDIIVPLITNTLLIGNICENEGLGYNAPSECRIKIRFFLGKDKEELIAKFNHNTDANNYPYISGEFRDKEYFSLDNPEEIHKENAGNVNDDGDKEIAVPGPLGEFALYSFLENFIRNAAKHNIKEWKVPKNLEINIRISEIKDVDPNDPFYKEGDQNEFYNVEIWDNVTDPNKQGFKVKENGKEVEKNLYEFINHQIRQPIINDDGSLRKGSWGIAEMKIMATLLRGSDCFEKMGENLRTIKTDDKLIYEFKVMKPKKVAIISRDTTKTSKYESQEFKNKGIWFFNGINDFFERLKNGRSRASFEFALLDKDTFEELKNYKNGHNNEYKRFLAILPFRVIVEGYNGSMEEIYKIIPGVSGIKGTLNNSTTPQDLINSIWQEWINYLKKRTINGTDVCLLLFLQQNNDEKPTNYYVKKANCMNNFHVIPKSRDGLQCNHNGSKLLLFDRHFVAYSKVIKERRDDLLFHEAIDKNNSDFIHMFSPPFVNGQISDEFIHTLIEAGLLRILIIDERIAEKAYDSIHWQEESYAERAYQGTQRIHAAIGGGIYICTHLSVFSGAEKPIHPNIGNSPLVSVRVKLNMKSKEDLDYSKEPTVTMILNEKEETLTPDAVIIHQGILENDELVGIRENQFGDFLEKIKEKYHYLVVDSGRGIPHKLHELAKFMPFSLLDDYIGRERIAKYNIVKILMSLSRRTNDE